jgi:hypothetical protein
VAARGTLAGDAYIYIHGGYILNIRSDVVEAAQTSSTQKKKSKKQKIWLDPNFTVLFY